MVTRINRRRSSNVQLKGEFIQNNIWITHKSEVTSRSRPSSPSTRKLGDRGREVRTNDSERVNFHEDIHTRLCWELPLERFEKSVITKVVGTSRNTKEVASVAHLIACSPMIASFSSVRTLLYIRLPNKTIENNFHSNCAQLAGYMFANVSSRLCTKIVQFVCEFGKQKRKKMALTFELSHNLEEFWSKKNFTLLRSVLYCK